MTGHAASLLTVFGATGDLAQRMLLPSLYGLQGDGLLPRELRILGTARSDLNRDAFRQLVARSIEQRVPAAERNEATLRALLERMDYCAASVEGAASMQPLTEAIRAARGTGDAVYHLSTAPRHYAPLCSALGEAGLTDAGTRVLLEKPIGHDLATSIAINDGVAAVFDEDRVFRVDHYLGKEGVQNLLALRFGNALFEPLWNARHVEQVQITVAESVGLEGRGDYYDHSGAMRDMLQNHLLQLLCLTAMEPPSHFDPNAVRNEKVKVLESLRVIGGDEVRQESVAGQYSAGAIDGVAVPGYREELGRASDTETFVALRAQIDNWRWSGVPFVLRSGKALGDGRQDVLVTFKEVPHLPSGLRGVAGPSCLRVSLKPATLDLDLVVNGEGDPFTLDRTVLHASLGDAEMSAYGEVLAELLECDPTIAVRGDVAEECWRIISPVLAAWRRGAVPLEEYPAGTTPQW